MHRTFMRLGVALLAAAAVRAQDAPPPSPPSGSPSAPPPARSQLASEPPAPAPPAIEERVEVALHLIDVVAVDRDGKPLRNLRRSNFEVRVDGEPRAIATLDAAAASTVAVRAAASPAESPLPAAAARATAPAPGSAPAPGIVPAPGSAPAPAIVPAPGIEPAPGSATGPAPAVPEGPAARWVVLLFDADRISPEDRGRALATAHGIVRTQSGPGDRYAVAVLRAGALEYVRAFGPAAEIVNAQVVDPDRILGQLPSIARRLDEVVENVANCRASRSPADCAVSATAEFVTLTRQESTQAVSALRDLVAALAPLPGRKALVLFTDGLILQPGQIALTAVNRMSDSAASFAASRLSDPPLWEYEAFVTEASRARVSLFIVRTGPSLALAMSGARSRWSPSEGDRVGYDPYMAAAQAIESSLRQAAEGTGGRAVANPPDADRLPPLLTRLDGVYTLGVPFERGDTIRSKVDVKLTGAAGRLVAPSRFAYRGRPPAPVGGRIVHGGGTDVRIEIDPASLSAWAPQDGAAPAESRVALYYRVVDAAGAVRVEDYSVIVFPRRPGKGGSLVHPLRLPVGPGTYTVSATVSDVIGRGRGTIDQAVTVPGDAGT